MGLDFSGHSQLQPDDVRAHRELHIHTPKIGKGAISGYSETKPNNWDGSDNLCVSLATIRLL